ncbi:MAG: hypothetical protein H0W83_03260 [Planctomycetes bacterium]|nr:hypothetical protein [Planctomycetota bacterium]
MSNDVRICFFGDRFVNGTRDGSFRGWPGRVSAWLHARGMQLTAYNLGVRRDTSADVLARWRFEAQRRLPDSIDGRLVFSFGVNDCVEEDGMPRLILMDTLKNAERILAEAAAWKPTLVVGPPAITMAGQDSIIERIGAVSCGLEGVCSAAGVPYLDLFSALIGEPEWQREIAAGDGVHPSEAGYDRLADIILQWPVWRDWLSSTTTS